MSYYEYHVARRYVQFEGAIRELPNYASLVGKQVLILMACDPVRPQIESSIREGIDSPAARFFNAQLAADSPRYARYVSMADRLDQLRNNMSFSFLDIGQETVCEKNIGRTAEKIAAMGVDTVVGVGGGRAQDYARALTRYVPVKVILVPTFAATNASISTLSVIYTEDGKRIEQYWRMDHAPELVLVDTEIIAQNEPWVLSAGVGDITSTYYEGLCNLRMTKKTDAISDLSFQGLRLAIDIMQEKAPQALADLRGKRLTQAFESVVSMIMHNCGPLGMICTLGFAHVLDEMLLYFDAAHRWPHGLRVGFATLPMLRYHGAGEDEINRYVAFCQRMDIPTSLDEMGLGSITQAQWQEAFDATAAISGSYRSLPYAVTAHDLIESLMK